MSYPDRMVMFTGNIYLTGAEIAAADGDLAQAVQNEIGASGAQVIEIDGGSTPWHEHEWSAWVDEPGGVARGCSCGATEWRPEG